MKQTKPTLFFLAWCCAAFLFLSACASSSTSTTSGQTAQTAQPAETVVYIVRHAEKETQNPQDQNPDLNQAGKERAQALVTLLKTVPVNALYATKYLRTQNTLRPLAQSKGMEVQTYEASDFGGLAQAIKAKHGGQTVVVAGHSNTVLPILEALGGKKPFAEITDAEYDHILKVTLRENMAPQVEASKYGVSQNR